jgi:ribosomal protein S18 acetylase RimI-like enzyme
VDRFASTFPSAEHIALGFDQANGHVSDLDWFAQSGFQVEASTVMTASEIHPPARTNRDAEYRRIRSNADWAQSVELQVRCHHDPSDPAQIPAFVTAQARTNRHITEAGHGGWFGAFVDDRLVAQMGLLAAGPGLARFQMVETDPQQRRRGLGRSLLHHVSSYGFTELGARTLVMVADPDYFAIDLYRSAGFSPSETQLQVERATPLPAVASQ